MMVRAILKRFARTVSKMRPAAIAVACVVGIAVVTITGQATAIPSEAIQRFDVVQLSHQR